MWLQIYFPSLSLHLWVAHHCFRSRNSAMIFVHLLTISILDCLIKADAWAQSLGLWSIQIEPTLPHVCGSHWCCSPNILSLTTLAAWQVVLPGFLIFRWDHRRSSGQFVVIVHHSVVMYYFWAGMCICQHGLSKDLFPFCHSYRQHRPLSPRSQRAPAWTS